MPVTESIINRMNQMNKRPILVGICGRAGSGKSLLVEKIVKELEPLKITSIFYHGDWRFRQDSSERKKWIEDKWQSGLDEYVRAINQFSWWDFENIYHDLDQLSQGKDVVIKNAYNRSTGKKDEDAKVTGTRDGIIFYENCVLGGIEILTKMDIVIWINETDDVCFNRLVKKDKGRRTFPDIMARTLITMYSENFFFKMLLDKFSNKLLVSDSGGIIGGYPVIEEVKQLPVPFCYKHNSGNAKETVFCDLDNILEEGENLQDIKVNSADKVKELKARGCHLVLTTSRPYNRAYDIFNKLKEQGIEFDQLVSDLPVGQRHVIDKHDRTKLYCIKCKDDFDKLKI